MITVKQNSVFKMRSDIRSNIVTRKKNRNGLLTSAIGVFIKWVTIRTPPAIGKSSIPSNMYYLRPLNTYKVAMNLTGVKRRDAMYKYHKGYKFALLRKPNSFKEPLIEYYKSFHSAKKNSRIKTRGMSRASWMLGIKINGVNVVNWNRLVAKSPKLLEYRLSSGRVDKRKPSVILNNSYARGGYFRSAQLYAYKYTRSYINHVLNAEKRRIDYI